MRCRNHQRATRLNPRNTVGRYRVMKTLLAFFALAALAVASISGRRKAA
jgi:hypothetical protein